MQKPLLEVKGLSTQFGAGPTAVHAVSDISFSVEQGSVLGVVGESGSGKSVTALSIMRLIDAPGKITAGQVILHDNGQAPDLLALPRQNMEHIRGDKISMIFQDPMTSLNPVLTIGYQIMEPLRVHRNMSSRMAGEYAAELLDRVGIPEARRRLKDFPHQFSGGMRQRVMIAIAVACKPKLLIADEPTTALDVTIQAQILDLLGEIKNDLGTSIIIITHDLGVIAQLADRVAVMYGGTIAEIGPVADIFARPQHPYTQALVASIPRLHSWPERLTTIEGSPPQVIGGITGCPFEPRCAYRIDKVQTRTSTTGRHFPKPCCCLLGCTGRRSVVCLKSCSKRSISSRVSPFAAVYLRSKGLPYEPSIASASNSLESETLGLVGESGSGKSTLALTIMRLYEPSSGQVRFAGQELVGLDDGKMLPVRRQMQMIFQDPFAALDPRLTVGQSIAEPLDIHGIGTPAERAETVQQLIERVGLSRSVLGRYPNEFSGGQQQRIGIARALALRPRLMICDEPVSALDVSVQAQILNLLRDLQDEIQTLVSFYFP